MSGPTIALRINPTALVRYLPAISLNDPVAFLKLLFRVQGSVWKLLWLDFLIYMLLYTGITVLYRYCLINHSVYKEGFEGFVRYMQTIRDSIPLSFLLGFFVNNVLGRWWKIIWTIPWMSKPAFMSQTHIAFGPDREVARNIRLTVMRYMNLAWIVSMSEISSQVKNRFLTDTLSAYKQTKKGVLNRVASIRNRRRDADYCDEGGIRAKMERINSDATIMQYFGSLVSEQEIAVLERQQKDAANNQESDEEAIHYKPDYWLPLQWATKLLERSLKAGYIRTEAYYVELTSMIEKFGTQLADMHLFNDFNIPLVYTQVVIVVVYGFFFCELFTQQFIQPDLIPLTNANETNINVTNVNFTNVNTAMPKLKFDAYVPILSIIKLVLYMGWFRTGLILINPMSNEESKFPLSDILDYNLMISTKCAPADSDLYPEFLCEDVAKKGDPFDAIFNSMPCVADTAASHDQGSYHHDSANLKDI